MVRTRAFHYAATLALGVTSAASAQEKPTKAQLAADAATVEQVAATVSIADDSLDTVARLSTEPFYVERRGLLKVTPGDKFVRAFVDKKTGRTKFQVYLWISHGGDWYHLNRANYEAPAGPVEVEATRIDSDVSCGRYGCSYREDVAFEVPENTLRLLAAGAAPGGMGVWRFKASGPGGDTGPTAMLKTEIAGLLLAVDRKRAALGLPAQ